MWDKKSKNDPWTHRKRLLPAGSHYGRSDDGDVELVLLLLHHALSQRFGVGVRVWPVADEPRRDVTHDAVVHPPEDRQKTRDSGGETQRAGCLLFYDINNCCIRALHISMFLIKLTQLLSNTHTRTLSLHWASSTSNTFLFINALLFPVNSMSGLSLIIKLNCHLNSLHFFSY